MAKTSIQYIKEAAKKLVDSRLQRLGAAKTQEIFKGVMQSVGLETMGEVYLFVAQFDLTCRDRISDMDDLASYFECSSLDMIEYVPALTSLESKGILVRRGRNEENILKQNYSVCDAVVSAVIDNKPVDIRHDTIEEVQMDKYEFCKRIAEKVESSNVVTNELILFAEKLEKCCQHLTFVRQLTDKVGNIVDRILFYDICHDNFQEDGDGTSDLNTTLKNLYSNISERIATRKKIVERKHILFTLELIELDDNYDEDLLLTDKGKEFFYAEDLVAFSKLYKYRDIYSFVNGIYEFFHSSKRYNSNRPNEMVTRIINKTVHSYEQTNQHLAEVKRIQNLIPDAFEKMLFYTVAKEMIDGQETSLSHAVKTIYPRQMRKKVLQDFKDKRSELQKKELVVIETNFSLFGEDTLLVMTDKAKEMLLGEDAELFMSEVSDKQLIPCNKITKKQLFFSPALEKQLSLLRNSLEEAYYQRLCNRIKKNNLPTGIAVLLYGEPGTGKTESVLQIAKATGRTIMHVDISATKTCWFGESEKLIKKVFTDYRRLCTKSKLKPILLFNEADAIFSKRKDVNNGSVAQTENAIQNIILEEMENLDGILIATTNLADNLDRAFERRFLFKIHFDKPTIEAKKNIWMNKLPTLLATDAQTLAAAYELSGGQIDNIVRKAVMQEIVHGNKPTLQSLVEICNEENIKRNGARRIGF
ncbi:AAA family ATPase [Hoylesella timonensis]|uniref:AAA family ATPase n=1 Tax=Hoylesella timonensis TaxID=386414 RepID=UPI00189A11B2|nr:ATP-binding protein [Hoylesella timonensis]